MGNWILEEHRGLPALAGLSKQTEGWGEEICVSAQLCQLKPKPALLKANRVKLDTFTSFVAPI